MNDIYELANKLLKTEMSLPMLLWNPLSIEGNHLWSWYRGLPSWQRSSTALVYNYCWWKVASP